jgi:hypothetical protein
MHIAINVPFGQPVGMVASARECMSGGAGLPRITGDPICPVFAYKWLFEERGTEILKQPLAI